MRWFLIVLVSGVLACGSKIGTDGSKGSSGGSSPAIWNTSPIGDAGSPTDAGLLLDTATAAPLNCPTEVTDLTGGDAGTDGKAVAISSGFAHTCVLLSDGTVKCWGDNSAGQLGVGWGCLNGSSIPLKVVNLSGVKAIASGDFHTCALLSDGTVKCWGETPGGISLNCPLVVDDTANLSCGILVSSGAPMKVGSMPGIVPGLNEVVATAGGNHQDCALRQSGEVRCWGFAGYGELGNGDASAAEVTTPVPVIGLSSAVSVTAGPFHSCAVLADGTARCWGANESGEIGDGTTADSSIPVVVANLENAGAIVSGSTVGSPNCFACYAFTCALLSDHSVKCWGSNQDGELGDGTTSLVATTEPVSVLNLTDAQSVTAGAGKMFAIRSDGTLAGWGSNRCGELGDGTTANATTPIVATNLNHVTGVAATACGSCAVLSDGTVYCWGNGPLGDGTWNSSMTPVQVIGL